MNKLNIINYNEFTKSIKHWNPYEDNYDPTLIENNQLYILGPINHEGVRYLWNFLIKNMSNNSIKINSIENTKNSDPCIDIHIKNNVGKIDYINKCGNYRGKDLIKWMLEIMKKMGCEKCILVDMAQLKCKNSNNNVSLSLIHKLWKGHTYYEDFGFVPYHKNNNSYKNNLLVTINNKIKQLQTIKWDVYSNYNNINDPNWNEFKHKYSNIYPSPFLAFKEFNTENCGIFYDILYLLDDELIEIKNLISKSVWMKVL